MRVRCLLPLLLTPGLSLGASFNCARATTPQEKAICASPKLGAADDRMAAGFAKVMAATPHEMVDAVRSDQRAWLKLMPLYCPVSGRREGESMAECLGGVYDARTKTLEKLVVRRAGVTFVSRSITLIVKEEVEGEPAPTQAMPGYGTLEVIWPIASVPSPEWNSWNKAIEDEVHRIGAPEEVGSGPSSVPPLTAQDGDDDTTTASVENIDRNLVTALVDHWWWRGAHPTEASIQLNWLLKEQRELRPEDVFRKDSEWKPFMNKRCDSDLHHQLDPALGEGGDYTTWLFEFNRSDALNDIVSDSRNWKLGRQGIEIVYQDYAVAPHAAHPSPTLISWIELKPYLQTSFTPPQTSAPRN